MASLHERKVPIPQDTQYVQPSPDGPQESLGYLQGNILQGHRRKHAVHIFLRFKDGKQTEVKQWIKDLAVQITSAQRQLEERNQDEKDRDSGRLFTSFFLSASGYEYFGLSFPKTYPLFDHVAFPWGMKRARERLNDPPIAEWQEGYRDKIHAMVLLAHNDENVLLKKMDKLSNMVMTHTDILAAERGTVMRNKQGQSIEHFGYVDGRSHPLFFESDIDRESRREGRAVWVPGPGVGPASVLVPDPYGRTDNSNGFVKYLDSGSYLVFRKLEQNVCLFKKEKERLAVELNLTGQRKERAGALIVGRFENGTPLIPSSSAIPHPNFVRNNFHYDDDPEGQQCPLHAHIRKVNPRQKDGPKPLIVRRGISYDERMKESKSNPNCEEWPSTGAGLLFMCYQKNIRENFEFIQREWADNPDFPKEGTGTDPIIGRPRTAEAGQQKWPLEGREQDLHQTSFSFPRVVTLKGGEYFFTPSIHFLQTMGER
jgi:Dyp-type peroxidase family